MFAYMWMFTCVFCVCVVCIYISACLCTTYWLSVVSHSLGSDPSCLLSKLCDHRHHHNLCVPFFSHMQSGIVIVLALHSTWRVIELVYDMQNVGSANTIPMMVSYLTAAGSQVLGHLSHGLLHPWPPGTASAASLVICCDHLSSPDCGSWHTSKQGNIVEGRLLIASRGPGISDVSGGGLSLLCF